jgi:hypothetical protein
VLATRKIKLLSIREIHFIYFLESHQFEDTKKLPLNTDKTMKKTIKQIIISVAILLILSGFCSYEPVETNYMECSDELCQGQYSGAEFINGSDIAHQFSNKMAEVVGDKLKALFRQGKYSKVDFDNIEMTTKGMGSGTVTYYLKIPFIRVKTPCEAYTSFDHVGGWNHKPELEARKKQLQKALMKNHKLNISNLKTTDEGLQEYWIQWKNKITQSMCE